MVKLAVENASDNSPQQMKLENLLPDFAGSSPPISPKTSPTSLWKSLVLNSLLEKVFRQISTLLENSSPIFRQHQMLSLPRFRQGKWLRERSWIFASETATAFLSFNGKFGGNFPGFFLTHRRLKNFGENFGAFFVRKFVARKKSLTAVIIVLY